MNKTRKSKIFSIIIGLALALCLMLTMMPMAKADSPPTAETDENVQSGEKNTPSGIDEAIKDAADVEVSEETESVKLPGWLIVILVIIGSVFLILIAVGIAAGKRREPEY